MNNLISNRVCILAIGDEILLGQITDTNAVFLAQSLSAAGLEVVMKMVAGDSRERILDAFAMAFERADILIITGGLGPTRDDLTKPLLAEWFHDKLEIRPEALLHLEALMKKRGREMSDMTRSQAFLPAKAEYLENSVGTAPGMWFMENGKVAVALPGVPYEMKQIFQDQVLPRLRERVNLIPVLHAWFRTVGIPESALAQMISDWENQLPPSLKLAYLPSGGQVKLRLTGRGHDLKELESLLRKESDKLDPLIAEHVYAREDKELDEVLATLLVKYGFDIFTEDELTKGKLNALFLNMPGMEGKLKNNADTPACRKGLLIRLFSEHPADDSPLQTIELLSVMDGKISPVETKTLRIFPRPEINQNMLCLQAMNMMRLWILGKNGK